jgi:ribonucleotide reductase alpha subunit
MRSLMTAGPALDRSEIAAFNCTYAAISGKGPEVLLWDEKLRELGHDEPIKIKIHNPLIFDESFFILLNGTGFGFSVERQLIVDLPTIGKVLSRSIYKKTAKNFPKVPKEDLSSYDKKTNTIIVADSKEGWASALRIFIVEMYNGNFKVHIDVSGVRPAGMPLKVFGGRSSGPDMLVDMLEKLRLIFIAANGRKLTSVECHDVLCFIAQAVISGGVRRSSLISLSNLSDERIRYAKSGNWWEENPQRSLANNSVAYTEKPEIGQFMREWQSLYESRSGERGIFNRGAAKQAADRIGRDSSYEFGTNPCVRGDTMILTKAGHFQIKDLVGKTVEVWDGAQWVEIDNFRVTGTDQEVWKVTLHDGSEIIATPYHTFITEGGDRVKLNELEVGDRLAYSEAPETHGTIEEPGAYAKGFALGDGSHTASNVDNPLLWVYAPKFVCEDRLIESLNELPVSAPRTGAITEVGICPAGKVRHRVTGLSVRKSLLPWCTEYKDGLPSDVFNWTKHAKAEFLAGLFDSDGTASDTKNGFMYQLTSVSRKLLLDVQLLLKSLGVQSKLMLTKAAGIKDFGPERGGFCPVKAAYRLTISQSSSIELAKQLTFSRLASFATKTTAYKVKSKTNKIVSIEPAGVEDNVYCCTVPTNHKVSLSNGIITGQCGEIVLRDAQACNLTSIVVREEDTLDTLKEKAEKATILGTLQSTLTDFSYLSPIWKENCEEERLLGVSMTGTMDHPVLSHVSDEAKRWLDELRAVTKAVNEEWAAKLGINKSAAITCSKPEGTSSQLNNTASGLHARHSPYYIRRVRADDKDPLGIVMEAQGYPCEPDLMQRATKVFSFPVKSPKSAVFRDDRTALEQLEYWLMFKQHWTDHNPSITISVKEKEWIEVAAWVYKNFEEVCGLSFLPFSNHVYKQAPFDEITKEQYEAMLAVLPEGIDYEALSRLETTDQTIGVQEFACSSGSCELL